MKFWGKNMGSKVAQLGLELVNYGSSYGSHGGYSCGLMYLTDICFIRGFFFVDGNLLAVQTMIKQLGPDMYMEYSDMK